MRAQHIQRMFLPFLILAQLTQLLAEVGPLKAVGRLSGRWRRPKPALTAEPRDDGAPAASCRYDAIVAEHASDLIALLDACGRYRHVSAAHTRSLGYAPAEMIGLHHLGFVHPDDQAAASASIREARAEGAATVVCRVAHREGGWRWVEARVERYDEGEGLLLLVARDITEQRAQERRLLLAQRTLTIGTLASTIVHDINNVLTVIEGSASLAADTLPDNNPAQEDLGAILDASRHGSDLTRRLLNFVRQQPPSPAALDLAAVIERLLPLVARLCAGRAEVAADIQPGLWPIAADRSQIEQVLINLAVNARDAMPEGGRLLVRARNEGEAWVRIEVSDSGVGMDEAALARAFEPFYTTKAPGRGSGLGLFASRHIIGELRGTIVARSTPGAGTTFTILLPRHER